MVIDSNYSKKEKGPQAKYIPYFIAKTFHFECLDSTNRWAKLHFKDWHPQGITLVSAETQTAGYGRGGKTWHSPSNVNLYLSFCFWFPLERTDLGNIPQILMISVLKILMTYAYVPKIKWPNDLLLEGKKLAGVLCETLQEEGRRGVICGLGLNVNMSEEMCQKVSQPCTSLFVQGNKEIDKNLLMEKIASQFALDLQLFRNQGLTPFLSFFLEHSFFKQGDLLCFTQAGQKIERVFETLDETGALQVRNKEGAIETYYSIDFVSS